MKDKRKAPEEPRFKIEYGQSLTARAQTFLLQDLDELLAEAKSRGFPPESGVLILPGTSIFGQQDYIEIRSPKV